MFYIGYVNMLVRTLMVILLCLTSVSAQASTTFIFTEEEVIDLYNTITELEYKDSINFMIISNLNGQLQLYFQQTEIDSTIIENYKEQLELKDEVIKNIKPTWYDNKYLWYSMGIASMIVPIWAIGQIQ